MIETWYDQDLTQPVKVQYFEGSFFSQDNAGNLIGVNVFDNGSPASLSGAVSASVIRADGATVAVAGTLSGNQCSVVLPQAAYAVPGIISVIIKIEGVSSITTVCAVVANVFQSETGTTVDPGVIIPDISALISAVEAAIASVPSDYSNLNRIVSNLVRVVNGAFIAIDETSNWEQGSINSSTGASSSSTTRIRSAKYMRPEASLFLRVPVGFKAYWYSYSQPSYTSYNGNSGGWLTDDILLPADGNYYKVCVAYTNDATITPAAATNCPLYIYNPTDKTLELSGKPADAGTIGDILKKTPVNMRWEQGRIKTDDGSSAADSARIRTKNYMKPVNRVVFDVPSGYKAILFWYSSPAYTSFVGSTTGGWTTDDIIFDDPSYYYRICLAKSDDSDITPEDASSIVGYDHLTRPYLVSSYDNTDRTGEIVSMLAMFGSCYLSGGDFYTTGILMPESSMLCGNGKNTRIILSANGNAIDLQTKCTVRDIEIAGSVSDDIVWSDSEDEKNGIYYHDSARLGTIINCIIRGFSGSGILANNTGYATDGGLNVSDCDIVNCFAGINLEYLSEFHRFGNCRVKNCRYAVINNGGNNMFGNCTFAANTDHFLIDNSENQSTNNAHGCATGCNFQHSGFDPSTGLSDEDGNAIRLLGTGSGYIFSGCIIGDGNIVIDDSYRINFSGCQFMEDIFVTISDGGLVAFCGCEMRSSFEANTTITNNTAVRFDACYTAGGTAVDPTA